MIRLDDRIHVLFDTLVPPHVDSGYFGGDGEVRIRIKDFEGGKSKNRCYPRSASARGTSPTTSCLMALIGQVIERGVRYDQIGIGDDVMSSKEPGCNPFMIRYYNKLGRHLTEAFGYKCRDEIPGEPKSEEEYRALIQC